MVFEVRSCSSNLNNNLANIAEVRTKSDRVTGRRSYLTMMMIDIKVDVVLEIVVEIILHTTSRLHPDYIQITSRLHRLCIYTLEL